MEPLRARRSAHDRPLGASSSSAAASSSSPAAPPPQHVQPGYPPVNGTTYTTQQAKPSLSTRPRKPSLSEDALARGPRTRAAAASWWHRCGGGLDQMQPGESRILLGLTLFGAVVRYWKIGRPSSVVCVVVVSPTCTSPADLDRALFFRLPMH